MGYLKYPGMDKSKLARPTGLEPVTLGFGAVVDTYARTRRSALS